MIQVINRALDIIEFIAKDPENPKSLGEIAEALNLNAGTCANIIKTLVYRKYLDKVDKQKGYRLGTMSYALTGSGGYKKILVEAAKDELKSLTKKINENSLIAILNGDIRVAIHREQGTNDIQANTPTERNAYETTSGRLLVAMLPEDEQQKYVKKYGLPKANVWEEASDQKGFEKQMKKIKSEQYAIQITQGQIVGLAVPVFSSGKVVASVGVYMPQFRFKGAIKEEALRLMKEHARRISEKIS